MVSQSASRQVNKRDLLAVVCIIGGYGLLLVLLPVTRDFGYLDDWSFASAAEHIVQGAGFRPSEYAQMTMITHVYWGAAFATLFGFSFTVLTLATMTMSLIGALAFYALLRRLGFGPGLSGLGVALLVLNPYYLLLSYSFMTDITFVTLLLLTCLCYLEGLRAEDTRWLWLGSVLAAILFLTRQFGLAVPLAAAIWLLAARRLNGSRLAAISLLPLLVTVGYYAWSRGYGPTYMDSVSREELLALVRQPTAWVTRFSHFVYLALFLPGLTVPLQGRVRHPRLIGALALGTAGLVYILWRVKANLVEQGQSSLDDLSYTWLQPFWKNPTLIYCLGAALTVWLVAGIIERSWPDALALLKRQGPPSAPAFLYFVALILFGGTYLISAGFLDRYWVPLLPFLIAAGLVGLRGASWRRIGPVLAVLLVVAAYGATAHLDDYAALQARWEAGRWLIAQRVPYEKIENGPAWDGYYLYDEAVQRLPSHDIAQIGRIFPPTQIIDPEYIISEQPLAGYQLLTSFSYETRLTGVTTHQLMVLKRQ